MQGLSINGVLCIFYAEFDNTVGPKILFQAPEGFFLADDFDSVSEYMITKPDLCGKVISVQHPAFRLKRSEASEATAGASARSDFASGAPVSDSGATNGAEATPTPVKVVTFPAGLSHEKYPRNSLLYTVGFVLPGDADTVPYEPVLRKLGLYLFSMEIESGFLFRPERKAALAEILPAILHGLNARGECFVAVDECDTIALKLYPSLPRPPAVKDSDVPVRVRDLDVLLGSGQDSGLDLGIRMIVPHIDGHNFVRVIAEVADVDISLVKRALQHLLYYGCIVMTDIFQYSNIYATQPRVQLLLRSRELSGACLRYISGEVGDEEAEVLASSVSHPADLSAAAGRPGLADAGSALSPTAVGGGAPPLSVDVIFNLYNAFGAGTRTCDVCAQGRTADMGIDDRRFISFGIIHGILRRLHKYPVPVSGSAGGRGWGGLVDEAALARCREAEAATLAAVPERQSALEDCLERHGGYVYVLK